MTTRLGISSVDASSSTPNYPAAELETQSPNTRGWMSAGRAVDPVPTVTVRLAGPQPSSVTELHLLNHETKIAKRWDVYVEKEAEDVWELLGCVEPDSNERSGFAARELISARLAADGVYSVKLVASEGAHENPATNPEGKVAIVGINVIGWSQNVVEERTESEEELLVRHLGDARGKQPAPPPQQAGSGRPVYAEPEERQIKPAARHQRQPNEDPAAAEILERESALANEWSGPPPEGFWSPEDEAGEDGPLPVAESLPSSFNKEESKAIQRLGVYTLRCIHSSNVKLRSAVVAKMERDVRAGRGDKGDLDAVLTVLAVLLGDAAPNVFVSSIRLFKSILERMRLADMSLRVFPASHDVLVAVVAAAASSSRVIASQASSLLAHELLAELGRDAVLRALLAPVPSAFFRPIKARLDGLLLVLAAREKHERADPDEEDRVLDWMSRHAVFEHANLGVRDAARALIHEMLARSLNPSDLVSFLKLEITNPKNLEGFVGKSASSPAAAAASPATTKRAPPREEPETDTHCPYCHVAAHAVHRALGADAVHVSPSQAMDLHFYADCPALTQCTRCDQIIEIALFNQHLLEECERKHQHRQCPRCGEAIASQFYDVHVARAKCAVVKPKDVANRCPLCHTDIEPFERGWETHLLTVGCPKNPRIPLEDANAAPRGEFRV